MKVLYIISLVLLPIFGLVIFYYLNEYWEAFWSDLFSSYSYDSYSSYDYSSYEYYDIATEGSLVFLLFIVFFILLYSFTIKNVKTVTAKVMSIIGLSFSGILLLITAVGAGNPGDADFDGVCAANMLYGIIMLAFCIVNLVQSVRKPAGMVTSNDLIIDDL